MISTASRCRICALFLAFSAIFTELNLTHAKGVTYGKLDIEENNIPMTGITRQYQNQAFYGTGPGGDGCPLCDASVYSYCSHKLIHDTCCCNFPVPYQQPPECYYYDCALLYAKSCYEHSLIKNCCCNSPY